MNHQKFIQGQVFQGESTIHLRNILNIPWWIKKPLWAPSWCSTIPPDCLMEQTLPSTSQAIRDCMLKGSWGTTAQLEWLEPRSQHTRSWTWHRAKGVFVHSWAGLQKAQPPADDLTHLHGDEAGLHVGWSHSSEAKTQVHTETSQGLVSVECTDASPPVLIFCLQNLYCMEHTPLIQCLLYGTHSLTERVMYGTQSSNRVCIVHNTLLWQGVYVWNTLLWESINCMENIPIKVNRLLWHWTHSSDREHTLKMNIFF